MSSHTEASEASRKLCEALLGLLDEALRPVGGADRKESSHWCSMGKTDGRRVAFVRHRSRSASLLVYLPAALDPTTLPSGMVLSPRNRSAEGWEKEFPHSVQVSNELELPGLVAAIAVLAQADEPTMERGNPRSEECVPLAAEDVRGAVRTWSESKFDAVIADAIEAFFDRAFRLARCPEDAWFGVHLHGGRLSLVVGGLWLAAINVAGRDRGVWLLTDGPGPTMDGVTTWPVKSFKRIPNPLYWTRLQAVEGLPGLLASDALWAAYSRATGRATEAGSGRGRADLNLRRGKVRVSEILAVLDDAGWRLPDELPPGQVYREGAVRQVTVNAHERNPQARRKCISHHGTACAVCLFDFAKAYGHQGRVLIHVHHIDPLRDADGQREVDPIVDLVPVCPNCHAMIHAKDPQHSIEEVRAMRTTARRGRPRQAGSGQGPGD